MFKPRKSWSLLSHHGQVLAIIAKHPKVRVVEIAKLIGISERSVRLLLRSLHRSKILKVHKEGRSNIYEVDYSFDSPHQLERSLSVKSIVRLANISASVVASVKDPLR